MRYSLFLLALLAGILAVQGFAANKDEEASVVEVQDGGEDFASKLSNRRREARFSSRFRKHQKRRQHQTRQDLFDARLSGNNDYKFKPLQILNPSEGQLRATTAAPETVEGSLTLYQYQDIWIKMLEEIYRILYDRNLLKEGAITTSIVIFLFQILRDIRHIEADEEANKLHCPPNYFVVSDTCVCVDDLGTELDFEAGRDYCRDMKGGDLAVIRTLKDFYAMVAFLTATDPDFERSYMLGAKKTIPGQFPRDRTFRQTTHQLLNCKDLMFGPGEVENATDGLDSGLNVIFNKEYQYYLSSVDPGTTAIPLCQFISSRDKDSFLYGQAIGASYLDWSHWYEWVTEAPTHKFPGPAPAPGNDPHSNIPFGWRSQYKRDLFDEEQPLNVGAAASVGSA